MFCLNILCNKSGQCLVIFKNPGTTMHWKILAWLKERWKNGGEIRGPQWAGMKWEGRGHIWMGLMGGCGLWRGDDGCDEGDTSCRQDMVEQHLVWGTFLRAEGEMKWKLQCTNTKALMGRMVISQHQLHWTRERQGSKPHSSKEMAASSLGPRDSYF